MSIQAIKAVGIGRGPDVGHLPGSRVHDEILPGPDGGSGTTPGVLRPTNNAGGLEGGVTNGEDVRVTAWMKPISTLMKPLRSVDLRTMDGVAGGHRAQRRVRRARRRRGRRSHGRASCSPTRCSRSSAATRWPISTRPVATTRARSQRRLGPRPERA